MAARIGAAFRGLRTPEGGKLYRVSPSSRRELQLGSGLGKGILIPSNPNPNPNPNPFRPSTVASQRHIYSNVIPADRRES